MEYWKKIEQNIYSELAWNIPESKQGSVSVIGGNSQSFNTAVRISEQLSNKFSIKNVKTILPDALQTQLPAIDNFVFLPSTDSGSFANSAILPEVFNQVDFNLVIGDLSKNSITEKAISNACASTEKPTMLTRDSVDLVCAENPEQLLMNPNIIIFCSVVQLQKLFRSVFYPKVILLSQPLMQIVEAIHKFTLSYPAKIITFHDGQILVAENGQVNIIPLEKTGYSPLTLWTGTLAAKIITYNLFNPNIFLKATTSAIF